MRITRRTHTPINIELLEKQKKTILEEKERIQQELYRLELQEQREQELRLERERRQRDALLEKEKEKEKEREEREREREKIRLEKEKEKLRERENHKQTLQQQQRKHRENEILKEKKLQLLRRQQLLKQQQIYLLRQQEQLEKEIKLKQDNDPDHDVELSSFSGSPSFSPKGSPRSSSSPLISSSPPLSFHDIPLSPSDLPSEPEPPSRGGGRWIHSTYLLLKREGRPLSINEILKLGLEEGMITTKSKTPKNTLTAILNTEVKKKTSVFKKVAPSYFALKTYVPTDEQLLDVHEDIDLTDLTVKTELEPIDGEAEPETVYMVESEGDGEVRLGPSETDENLIVAADSPHDLDEIEPRSHPPIIFHNSPSVMNEPN
eukprot:TRINITY_DN9753_c0_g1_i1.p1 TRINITY_DN9753_c0_g1~~TRINITY_DN9753_c0_g1_i1.p1  ORF type:complete len:376 (+),score=115.86 TRINITY_DN9753_c0_g1_i1:29-1156(+)